MAVGLLLAVTSMPALAELEADPEPQAGALLTKLGSSPSAELVDAVVAATPVNEPSEARALAWALGHAGGRSVLPPLEMLLRSESAAVRMAALDALDRTNLRSEKVVRAVRNIAREAKGQLRAAAAVALGAVGDGRDVELLLSLTKSENESLRLAAFRALSRLTGANIPYVEARWTYYWKSYRRRAGLLLPQTLEAVAMDAGAPDASALVDLMRLYAWIDVPMMRNYLADWLHDPDTTLRVVACRLIAHLRLADLGPDVEMTLRFAAQDELREEAQKALAVLGVPVDDS
jgi:HEAT repeat protein